MKRPMLVCVVAVSLAGTAWAQNQEPKSGAAAAPAQGAPAMDMTKVGPMARKPTNEQQTKKEIAEFFKQQEELAKKGDMERMLARIDFPLYMVTDDLKGVPRAKEYSREEYVAMVKPFYESMPKDVKVTHKSTFTVLSDSLVNVTDDFTMTTGKQKVTGRMAGLLVKRDGQWKWKSMAEAGWGEMFAGTGGSPKPTEGKK